MDHGDGVKGTGRWGWGQGWGGLEHLGSEGTRKGPGNHVYKEEGRDVSVIGISDISLSIVSALLSQLSRGGGGGRMVLVHSYCEHRDRSTCSNSYR